MAGVRAGRPRDVVAIWTMGRSRLLVPWNLAMAVALSGIAVAGCGRLGFDDVDASAVDASASVDVRSVTDVELHDAVDEPAQQARGPLCTPPCTNAHGTTICVDGICLPSCAPGYSDCDSDPSNGCEANLLSDPTHCGKCAGVCAADGGNPVCLAGVCGPTSCGPGTGDCE
jgi:hypothetical protein